LFIVNATAQQYTVASNMKRIFNNSNPKRADRLSRNQKLDLLFDLVNAFSSAKTPSENALFIQDLLTAGEIENLSKRLRIAKLILTGESQREIAKTLHCSFATITKVSIWLNEGGEGFKNAISKLPRRYAYPKNLPKGPIEFHLPELIIGLSQYAIAGNQNKKIHKMGKLLEKMEDKKIMDKSLQEATDEEFRNLASIKKRKKFIKETTKQL